MNLWQIGLFVPILLLRLCTSARLHGVKNTTVDFNAKCKAEPQVPYYSVGLANTTLKEAYILEQCKGSTALGDRLLVSTVHHGGAEWMEAAISIPFIVYFAGSDNATHSHPNVGLEAMGILTFIAEYYDCLPKVVLFAHPHRESYHTYRSLDKSVDLVRWGQIPGYATLHPFAANWADFNPRDPLSNLIKAQNPAEDFSCDYVINGTAYEYWPVWEYRRAQWIARAWDQFFGPAGFGPLPERVRSPLVAELFATKERIRLRPRSFYIKAIQWILDSHERHAFNSWELAVIFEMMWHHIFGEPIVLEAVTRKPCELFLCETGVDTT